MSPMTGRGSRLPFRTLTMPLIVPITQMMLPTVPTQPQIFPSSKVST